MTFLKSLKTRMRKCFFFFFFKTWNKSNYNVDISKSQKLGTCFSPLRVKLNFSHFGFRSSHSNDPKKKIFFFFYLWIFPLWASLRKKKIVCICSYETFTKRNHLFFLFYWFSGFCQPFSLDTRSQRSQSFNFQFQKKK